MRLVLINFSPRYLQLNKDPRIEIFIFKLVYIQDFMLFGKLGTTFVIFSFLHTFDWNLLLQGKRFTAVLKKGALPIPSFPTSASLAHFHIVETSKRPSCMHTKCK